jgi:hypothetical protein
MRNYLETVISTAYFKVPEFRQKFLECLHKPDASCIQELQSIGLSSNQIEESLEEDGAPAALSHIMDWSCYFHDEIPEVEENK